jgi:hypothetical protein
MKTIFFSLLLVSTTAFAEYVPVEYVNVFAPIDWEAAEKLYSTKAKVVEHWHTMQCDDSYSSEVEIKFEGSVGSDVEIESTCMQIGSYSDSFDTWIRFDGPADSECEIKVKRIDPTTKAIKAIVTYGLNDAC